VKTWVFIADKHCHHFMLHDKADI